MINKDKIFKLFLDGKEINDPKTEEKLKDFMNGPFAKIGMFVKLIQNHHIFHKKLEKFLKKEQPNYIVESTKEASEFTVYNMAYNYIKKISLKMWDNLGRTIAEMSFANKLNPYKTDKINSYNNKPRFIIQGKKHIEELKSLYLYLDI